MPLSLVASRRDRVEQLFASSMCMEAAGIEPAQDFNQGGGRVSGVPNERADVPPAP